MVDVCLLTEGSWPHTVGGVSVWADRLMRALPDVSFSVVHLSDGDAPAGPAAYAMPGNVAEVVSVARERYALACAPGAEAAVPEARVYHAALTGAASDLAERAADAHGGALVVTEHGLAWREMRVYGWTTCTGEGGDRGGDKGGGDKGGGDKGGGDDGGRRGGGRRGGGDSRAATLFARPLGELSDGERAERRALVHRRADAVEAMARRAYERAGAVTSVSAAGAAAQIRLGAPADKVRILPNAAPAAPAVISAGRLPGAFRVGLVGRVVPVKDVLGFLRAGALLAEELPGLELTVVGPVDEAPAYAARCHEAARRLGIEERVVFTGEADPAPWYGRLDALALTSVSEAQPLVLLEAMAHGVPVVATDVGGVAEVVRGAGLLVAPRDPLGMAGALLSVARDPALGAALSLAGRRRVAARHDGTRVHRAYAELYERLAVTA